MDIRTGVIACFNALDKRITAKQILDMKDEHEYAVLVGSYDEPTLPS